MLQAITRFRLRPTSDPQGGDLIPRKKCSLAVVGVAVLLSGCPVACTAQKGPPTRTAPPYRYDTAGVRLEGTLSERKEYGPPGYGETPAKDKRETIFVLKLSSPVSVQPAANAEASGPGEECRRGSTLHTPTSSRQRAQAARQGRCSGRHVERGGGPQPVHEGVARYQNRECEVGVPQPPPGGCGETEPTQLPVRPSLGSRAEVLSLYKAR